MTRGTTAEQQAELGRDRFKIARMLTIEFDEGPIRYTNWGHDIEWNGWTWIADGTLLGFGSVTEDTSIEIAPWSVSLSAVDQVQLALALSTDKYLDRKATLLAALMRDGQLYGDPFRLAQGRTDTPRFEERPTGNSALQITVTTEYGDIDGKLGRQTNDLTHQALFPGDRFFNLVSQTPKRLIWGDR